MFFHLLGLYLYLTYLPFQTFERTMQNIKKTSFSMITFLFVSLLLSPLQANEANAEFKEYWYAGDAELTSYELKQARYGELREGTSVLVYVSEPFLAKEQVKADKQLPNNIPVLKLNATKKFLTGLYPYSIMTSTFSPILNNSHAIKVSMSMQEWCGHVFTQLNNKEQFNLRSFSYFDGEADQQFSLAKQHLENELWTKIRLNPESLPLGNINIIPSFEYVRLVHKPLQAYSATASLTTKNNISIYTLTYPTLNRTLSISFASEFPYIIQSWQDTYKSGFDENAKVITSTATIKKTIKSKYWEKHSNADEPLRKALAL